ncbi:major facilitator superfamily MFS_1 [Beutenbergia cavernae DSM 12333]|uniref:Major facilitator superfamily MFS_1 n=1 Tax=Beutenbergia cavernae (strain ATCC BAA-8 / DSM 12333 / CCUG 43141 / JCM 11478 / NBRC 16432 / NCIMB 13614 / HKI 0122) TaxID=471853 RepID=C5C0D4_BEUC1|nr:major facilitator superfamily MFS_1 [Beutenbergia cavernae DSM 12333]
MLVCLALLLEGMASSSINVQVEPVRVDLGLGPVELQLVASAFLVLYAGLLPIAGRLVDSRGARGAFRLGVALFVLGSLLCAGAWDGWALVAGRAVQGVGAALSAPAALALVTSGLGAGSLRDRAVATYGAMGAAGFSLGLVVPGFVVAHAGWRASFAVLAPVGIALAVATWHIERGAAPTRERVGGARAVVLTAVLAAVLVALGGIGTLPASVVAGVGAAALAGAVALALAPGRRLVPPELLRLPSVRAASVSLAALFAGVLASLFVVSLALQTGRDLDAFDVGLLLLPQPLAFALVARVGARAVGRWGAPRALAAGIGAVLAALAALSLAPGLPTAVVLPAMAGIGVGLALAYPAASIWAVDGAPPSARGTTAALLTTAQNVGGASGLAVLTALSLVPPATSAGPGLMVSAALLVLGAALAFTLGRRTQPS